MTRRVHRGVVTALSLGCVLASFAPWARSGARRRNSYELVDVAGAAGVLPDWLDAAAVAWFLIPALGGATLLATASRRWIGTGLGAATVGALSATGGLLVISSPLSTEIAAVAAVLLGGCTFLSGTWLLAAERRDSDDD